MAITAKDYFRPSRMIGGGNVPLLRVYKESAITWSKGDVVVAASGYAVLGADHPTVETVLGVAAHAVVSGELSGLIYPALPNVVFKGRIAADHAGVTTDLAATNRYTHYDVAIGADTAWLIDIGSHAGTSVTVIDFIDAIGTAWGWVEFVFQSSLFNILSA
jgi:hypothetical protein